MKFKISKKVFIHVDCDSFFAECEILRKPYLKNSYVLVWEEIVIACNYKTKAFGIKTWTPVWEAREILKGKWVFLACDHNFYALVSSKLMKYLEENTLSVEPFSIDEAFCDITWLPDMNKLDIWDYIKKLQLDILDKIWVPVSIWVSNTRIKAKIFSKLNKPFWYYISLSSSLDKQLFSNLPISIVPFIWKSSQAKLKYKAKTVYDFISLWYDSLKKTFWKNATDLWLELSWVNIYRVKKSNYSKSMSRWRSFNKHKTNNKEFLYEQLVLNFNHLYEEMIEKEYELKKVSIFFRDIGFYVHVFSYDFNDFIDSRKDIFEIVRALFLNHYDESIICRSTWVLFSWLRKKWFYQTSIFDKTLRDKSHNLKLSRVINAINSKYNTHKISYGTYLLDKSLSAKLGIRSRGY